MDRLIKFLFSILICEGVGILGSFFTLPSIINWYATLNKPFFNPPDWIFGPVWTILYFLMGVSLFIIWEKGADKAKNAILFFSIQLALNFLWSVLFFYSHQPLAAFLEIIILWVFILLTILSFGKISKNAGLILIPYILWVSFAGVLNLFIVLLN